jgi:hypothetical protein
MMEEEIEDQVLLESLQLVYPSLVPSSVLWALQERSGIVEPDPSNLGPHLPCLQEPKHSGDVTGLEHQASRRASTPEDK